jgi:hypothetical protein
MIEKFCRFKFKWWEKSKDIGTKNAIKLLENEFVLFWEFFDWVEGLGGIEIHCLFCWVSYDIIDESLSSEGKGIGQFLMVDKM